MTPSDTAELLRAAFPDPVRDAIIDALEATYYNARERWDRSIGCDGLTFGVDVYSFACFELAKQADEAEGIELVSRRPVFRLKVGDLDVGCHRVGNSEADDINAAFPQSECAAVTLAPRQVEMFPAKTTATLRGVVIAHMGSPTEGLCSVHLCVPGTVSDSNRIDSWGYVEQIWSRTEETATDSEIKVELPPVEEIARPAVRRRPKAGSSS